MAANLNTYGDISPRTAAYAARKLLSRGQYMMVAERFGQIDPQPKKNSMTRKYRRYNSLAWATAPLAEGVTPSGDSLTYTDVTMYLQQYGAVNWITDVIEDTHEDPVLTEMMELAGEQMGETIEIIRFAVLKAGSNVFYANGVASRATVNSPATRGDLRTIKRSFKRNKAREIQRIIKATADVATEPVGAAYFAMGHTDLEPDIRGIPGFVPIEKYSDPGRALEGEVGKVENIRFILTPLLTAFPAAGASGTTYLSNGAVVTSAANADVYPLVIVARDAYGIVPLQGYNAVKPMVKNTGTPTDSDPLGQRGFVSWKTYQGAVILNDNWMARLEVAATAVPS